MKKTSSVRKHLPLAIAAVVTMGAMFAGLSSSPRLPAQAGSVPVLTDLGN